MAVVDGRRGVGAAGRTAVDAVSSRDIGGRGAQSQRSAAGDLVGERAAGIVAQIRGRLGDRLVKRKGQAGRRGIAGGVGVGDDHRVAAISCRRGISAAGRAAVDAVSAGDIRSCRVQAQQRTIGNLVSRQAAGIVEQGHRGCGDDVVDRDRRSVLASRQADVTGGVSLAHLDGAGCVSSVSQREGGAGTCCPGAA